MDSNFSASTLISYNFLKDLGYVRIFVLLLLSLHRIQEVTVQRRGTTRERLDVDLGRFITACKFDLHRVACDIGNSVLFFYASDYLIKQYYDK